VSLLAIEPQPDNLPEKEKANSINFLISTVSVCIKRIAH
jgi:hypothetical protein